MPDLEQALCKRMRRLICCSPHAQLMEEVKFDPEVWVEVLKLMDPLSRMQPEHGDIIIVQEAVPEVLCLCSFTAELDLAPSAAGSHFSKKIGSFTVRSSQHVSRQRMQACTHC